MYLPKQQVVNIKKLNNYNWKTCVYIFFKNWAQSLIKHYSFTDFERNVTHLKQIKCQEYFVNRKNVYKNTFFGSFLINNSSKKKTELKVTVIVNKCYLSDNLKVLSDICSWKFRHTYPLSQTLVIRINISFKPSLIKFNMPINWLSLF